MDYVKYIRSMVSHNKIIMNAAGGIIAKDNKILLQKRSDNNEWGLFGGIMEMDETYEACAKREIYEETGLIVELEYLIGIYHNFNVEWPSLDKAHVIVACYKCNIVGGNLKLDSESKEYGWFSLDSLPKLWAKDHIEAINDFKAGLKNQIH